MNPAQQLKIVFFHLFHIESTDSFQFSMLLEYLKEENIHTNHISM